MPRRLGCHFDIVRPISFRAQPVATGPQTRLPYSELCKVGTPVVCRENIPSGCPKFPYKSASTCGVEKLRLTLKVISIGSEERAMLVSHYLTSENSLLD